MPAALNHGPMPPNQSNQRLNISRPWLRSYPKGMPQIVGPPEHASLAEFFGAMMSRYASRPALGNLGTILSYERWDRLSRCFAHFLRYDLSLVPGERIAIILPNLLQAPVALVGALRAGLIVVNTNPLYTPRELEHQLRDCGASIVVALETLADTLAEVVPKVPLKAVVMTHIGDLLPFPKSVWANLVGRRMRPGHGADRMKNVIGFRNALAAGRRHPVEELRSSPDDIALIQYTGGTTGLPKGTVLTHRNLLTNTQQAVTWITRSLAPERHLQPGREIVITALPLYHIFCLQANLLCFTALGGLNTLITNPRDTRRFLQELRKTRFTCMIGVNTLFRCLLDIPEFRRVDFSSLKFVLGGGMPLQESVARRWLKVTGCPITEGYGLTEASPAIAINLANQREFTGSIGLPLPSTDCSIRDDTGTPLPIGEAGELCVRGPQVMKGYWQRPEETADVLTPEGWLRTGDIARMDEDGYLYVVDRKKDMILVSGFNVYPSEIEAVLDTHPGIRECAAVGVPDDKTGEAVRVFVVRTQSGLEADDVRCYCRARLAAYKVPKYIEFREELPKSTLGKVLRRRLRT